MGITSQKPEKRWKNGEGYRNCSHFYPAIQKYGWHSFRHEILYTDLTQEEAGQMEIKLIAEYGTLDPEKGYNLDLGGAVRHHSQETKRKIGAANKGRAPSNKGKELSPETRAKISAARMGRTSPNKGKSPSPETRAKISAANRGRKPTPETLLKLSLAHRGQPSPMKGRKLDDEARAKLRDVNMGNTNAKRTPVLCVETTESFASAALAGRVKNIYPNSIIACCRGKQKTAGGYHWEYADTPIFDTQDFCRKEVKENDRQV